jgi:hypothetical protein
LIQTNKHPRSIKVEASGREGSLKSLELGVCVEIRKLVDVTPEKPCPVIMQCKTAG